MVGLKEYLYRLPLGMDAILQPEGKGLPKSLAQKILLARGLVGKPQGLILENVLQYVEPEVKNRVIDYLFKGNWTLLMIAYDEESLRRADEVIVMDEGRIVFQGSYQEFKNS